MRKATPLVLALLLCLAIAAQSAQVAPRLQTQNLQLGNIQRLGQITRNQLLLKLNKQVEVEGFFYDGSIPMVVDNMNTVRMDLPMPPDKYVPIVGPTPRGMKWGTKVKIRGQVQRPKAGDPAGVQGQSLILRVSGADQIQVVQQPLRVYKPLLRVTITSRWPGGFTVFRQDKFAVLIVGGYNAANNHLRYWHDLVAMYNILKNAGYKTANIYVIYANGVGKDASIPVNYSATKANISTVFTQLAGKMDSLDTLYIMLNDHGGNGSGDPSGDETITHTDEVLWLWNGVAMTDDEFAVQMNKIMTTEIQNTVQGKKSAKQALDDAAAEWNKILAASAK